MIPATANPGTYRMRVGDRYSSQPIPCNTLGYGEAHDYTVVIGVAPSCLPPSGLSAGSVTTNTASISWTASSSSVGIGYEYYVSASNTAPTARTAATGSVGASSTSAPLSGLSPATTYYVWVRSVCSATDKSVWTSSVSFTTLCTSTGVPYTLDFESAAAPSLPGCTLNVNAGTGNNWTTAAAPTDSPGFSTKVLRYAYNSTNAANAWFFTQGINLVGGSQYTITYKYGNNSTTYIEKLKVAYGTSSSAAGMTSVLADYPSIADKMAHTESITFTPSASGTYYFGFNAYSDADQYYLYVDDINISTTALATAEISGTKNMVRVYPNPFTDVLNISKSENVKSVSVMDASGRVVKTIDNPASQLPLKELRSGVYMLVLSLKDGSIQSVKVIKR